MNFFSHFHFFRGSDTLYNTGLVLPDFSKISTGSRIKVNIPAVPHDFQQVQAGCSMHVETDKWFHGSAFFSLAEAELKAISPWYDFAAGYHRSWFVSHILVELMLDRVLIRQHSSALHDFYTTLRTVDEKVLNDFMVWQETNDIPKFFHFLHRFREAEYMFEYLDDERFAFSLGQICRRAGLVPFEQEQVSKLLKVIPVAEKMVTENLSGLLHEISDFRVKLDNLAADAGV